MGNIPAQSLLNHDSLAIISPGLFGNLTVTPTLNRMSLLLGEAVMALLMLQRAVLLVAGCISAVLIVSARRAVCATEDIGNKCFLVGV